MTGLGAIIIWGGLTFEETFTWGVAVAVGIATLPGVLLMLAPLPGFWEVHVNGDEITVIKAVIFRKQFLFSEITHCKTTRGGIKVYVKGRKRKGFFVDAMLEGAGLFMERIQKANIPVDEIQQTN